MTNLFSKKGQSLLELVVSIGLLIVVVTALAITTINGLRNSQFSQNQDQATKLAQDGLDGVKNIKARNCPVNITGGSTSYYWYNTIPASNNSIWVNAPIDATTGRTFQYNLGAVCSMTENGTETIGKFSRLITVKKLNSNFTVTSVVTWNDSTGSHNSTLSTLLTDY